MNSPSVTPQRSDAPIARSEVDAWLGRVYPQLAAGEPASELLNLFCKALAERLDLKLVKLALCNAAGVCETKAQSAENPLWAELQQVPERWDEGFTGNGPAGSAVRFGRPVMLQAGDECLRVWRPAIDRARLGYILAWPFEASGQRYVLELFGTQPADSSAPRRSDLAAVVERLARLIEDSQRLEQQRLLAASLESTGNAAFVTDLEGTIAWCNRAFVDLSGYARSEVVGKNPRFLKSGQQSVRYYRELWNTIRSGRSWSGETVDRDKDGRSYTIQQTVSPVALDGRVTHYISVQTDITRQKLRWEKLERSKGDDPVTGLLTRSSFDAAATDMLSSAAAAGGSCALAILSSGSLREGIVRMGEEMAETIQAGLGEQLRTVLQPPALACASQPGEFLLLLPRDMATLTAATALLADAVEALRQPLPLVGEGLCRDLRAVVSFFPAEGDSLTALRLSAERKLAGEPAARSRRAVRH